MNPKKKKSFGLANPAMPFVWFFGVCFFALVTIKGFELLLRLGRYIYENIRNIL
jgi:hypothetical protein